MYRQPLGRELNRKEHIFWSELMKTFHIRSDFKEAGKSFRTFSASVFLMYHPQASPKRKDIKLITHIKIISALLLLRECWIISQIQAFLVLTDEMHHS